MEETQGNCKLEESIVSARNSQSAAFTISFDDDQTKVESKKLQCSSNPFVKRHIRNKSLPVGPIATNITKVHYEESKRNYSSIKNGGGSANSSDGGTYTLDTDNRELQEARHSIDKVFGVQHDDTGQKTNGQWLDDWLQESVQNVSRINVTKKIKPRLRTTSTTSIRQSKIPSPIYHNNYQTMSNTNSNTNSNSNNRVTVKSIQAALYEYKAKKDAQDANDIDRELLKDSEDDKKQAPFNSRLNRAFSLRRDRLINGKCCASSIPSKLNTVTIQNNNNINNHQRYSSTSSLSPNLSNSLTKSSPPVAVIPKERKRKPVGNSNSHCLKTKSSHQADLLNWTRRKNYDPIKAAAEGRRKSMEKHQKGENNASGEKEVSWNSVCRIRRSASFQDTTVNVNNDYDYETDTFSSTDDTEITVSIEDDDYKIPKAPSTSLRNSPVGSLVDCCACVENGSNSDINTNTNNNNNSNSSIIQEDEENVDAKLLHLSQQIRLSSYHLLHALRKESKDSDNNKERNEEESSNEMFAALNTSTLDNLVHVSLVIQDLHELLLR